MNEKVEFSYANTSTGVVIKPGNVKIKVEARKLVVDSDSEFGLADTTEKHTAHQFAKYFTEHFEEIANEVPEIKRLKQIALLTSLAEFFRDTLKVPKELLNLEVLKSRIPKTEDFYPQGKVPRLSQSEERVEGDFLVTLNVTGGITLVTQTSNPVYDSDLISYLKRSEEYLTPFQITHFDYMKELLEYNRTMQNINENVL